MSEISDMHGLKCGRLLVLYRAESIGGRAFWACRCDCGEGTVVAGKHLRSGATQSCGCLRNERVADACTTHGLRQHYLFGTHYMMLERCYNPKHQSFPHYGARGIKVHLSLQSMSNFALYIDMNLGERPVGFTLDRLNNDGDYAPGNLRWASDFEQASNTSRNVMLSHEGETKSVSEWARLKGISVSTLFGRLNDGGWSVERSLTQEIS